MTETSHWQVGQTIEDLYQIRGINTEGGMSIVHFVWHTGWNMELVIKSLRPELLADQTARDRFTGEAETWVNLGLHPNIVTAYYVRQIEDFPRIILERMDGGSLRAWFSQGKVQDLATALDIAVQIATGLAWAQERQPGLVHRDVKPANILMTPDGEAKVSDYGLVGATGSLLGTPAYMAPEMWLDSSEVTPAADVYSFGVVLHELLAGRRPFHRGDTGTSLGQIGGGRGVDSSLGAIRQPMSGAETSQGDLSLGAREQVQRATNRSLGELGLTESMATLSREDVEFYRDAHLRRMPESPLRYNHSVPKELAALTLELLAKSRDRRPAIGEVVTHLRALYAKYVGQRYPRDLPKQVKMLADSLNNRAVSMLDLNRRDEAERWLSEALTVDSHHPEATYNRGLLQWLSGGISDLDLVAQLHEVCGTHATSWRAEYLLGQVQCDRGDAAAAVRALETAAKCPDAPGEVQASLNAAKQGLGTWRGCLHVLEAHQGSVDAFCLGPGSHTGLSGGWDGTVRLWDLNTGQCLLTFQRCQEAVQCVRITPDGRFAVTGHASWGISKNAAELIRVWDLGAGHCLRTLKGPVRTVTCLDITSCGRWVVAGDEDGMIRVWELATGQCQYTFPAHILGTTSLCISPDDRWVFSGGEEGTLHVSDLHGGFPVWSQAGPLSRIVESKTGSESERQQNRDRRLDGFRKEHNLHLGRINAVRITPDGKRGISAGEDRTIRLWDLATGHCERILEGHRDAVNDVQVSPDGRLALSAGSVHDTSLGLWEIDSGRRLESLLGHTSTVECVRFTPDGRQAVSGGSDNTVRLWELHSGRCLRTLEGHTHRVNFVDVHPDGHRALSGAADGTLRIWSLSSTGTPARVVLAVPHRTRELSRQEDVVRHATKDIEAALAQGRPADALAEAARTRQMPGYERHPALLDLWQEIGNHGTRTRLLEALAVGKGGSHEDTVTCVALTANGRFGLSSSWDGTVRVWDLPAWHCLHTLEGHGEVVFAVSPSPDGHRALSAGADDTIRLWELSSGANLKVYQTRVVEATTVCFSPDGRLALVAGAGLDVRLFELATGNCLQSLTTDGGFVNSVCFSSNGLLALVGSSDGRTSLWDLTTGQRLRILEQQSNVIKDVCICPDGRRALSACQDKTLRLWDLATEHCLQTLEGHTGMLNCVCVSPDGHWAFSGDGEGMVKMWDLESGHCIRSFTGQASIWSVCISADARRLLAGGADGAVRVWELVWDFEFPKPADWDDRAESYLESFLTLHCAQSEDAIGRAGAPSWDDEDVPELLEDLRRRGFGWLRPEGVRRRLHEMASEWNGLPPLPGTNT